MKKLVKKYLVVLMSVFMVFAAVVPTATVEAASKQLIIVNTKYNKLSFYNNDKLVKTFNVASGKPSTPTPTGKTRVANKIVNRPYYSGGIPGGHPNNPLGNRWIGIFGGGTYAIHGNNKESSIGKHVSGGCIRMHNAEIRWLFPQVNVGCTVLIDYSTKTDAQIAKKYGVSFKEPVKAGWKTVNGQKKYLKANGKYAANEWLTISGKKYHFAANGLTDKGMQTISGKKYYFDKDGVMKTGWITEGDFKYYFDKNGPAHIGWLELNGKSYYFDQTGAMVTGEQNIDGIDYSFNENGEAISKWDVIKGNNRFSTATEISKMNYATGGTVVLVNGNAVADGIAATPLAASENASILLANTNNLPKETANRMKEITPQKVIIVGGENAVSKALEAKIANDYAVEVQRIAGKDRYATSFEIAKKLVESGAEINTAYIVAGTGEADALSVASKAGADKQPIILTGKDSIAPEMYAWLKEQNLEDAYFIGGNKVISDNVINSVNEITTNDVTANRIAGNNREETNAKVIEKLYTGGFSNVYAAKSNVLVDALSAGPMAAQRNCPVVLVNTNGLTDAQKNVLSGKYADHVYQIGGGVSFKGMSELYSICK
ncbi:cell wall-binding repeat-containing protein [Peptacetobacter hiranonis]|uniref:cell wall-binding repeat-containing protein n=1 Tax=Peptacetobacter hiranonis TaxID=89152 RepID=UPI0019177C3F|nr:cell wall-binding repeat-containing protein [Peptacetobacter hiranonis]QQQ86059.1 cell wall-binding repeat-containing protein [Peptacetobacter hiranonis]